MACCCELQNTLDVEVTQDALLDMEIGGSAGVLLQAKSVEVTANGTSVVAPDDGFDGMQFVEINTNTPKNITGAIGVPDGMSIAQLLCSTSAASSVTEIVDDNTGWDCKDGSVQALLTMFPNTEKLTLGMGIIHGNGKCISKNSKLKGTVSFPALKRYGQPTKDSTNGIIYGCPNVTRLDMSAIEYVNHYSRNSGSADFAMIGDMQGLYEIDFGNITTWTGSWTGGHNFIIGCPKSGCLKFKSVQCSMNLMYWNPSVALDASSTDLIEEGSTATNNLQQFLQNFRDYIAERLTDNGKGLYLTLSQEVRNAIHAAEDEYGIENIIIPQKGWTISPAQN